MISIPQALGLDDGGGVVSIIGAGGKTSLMFALAKELAGQGAKVLATTTTNIFYPSTDQAPATLVAEEPDEVIRQAKAALNQHNPVAAGSFHVPGHGKLKGFPARAVDRFWASGCFDWVIAEADGARRLPIKASDSHEPVVASATRFLVHVTGLDALGTPLDDDHVHRPEIFSRNTGLASGMPVDGPAMAKAAVLELRKASAMAAAPPCCIAWLNKADTPDRTASGNDVAGLVKALDPAVRVTVASLGLPAA